MLLSLDFLKLGPEFDFQILVSASIKLLNCVHYRTSDPFHCLFPHYRTRCKKNQKTLLHPPSNTVDHSLWEHTSQWSAPVNMFLVQTPQTVHIIDCSHLRSLLSGGGLFCFLRCDYDNLFLFCCLLVTLCLHLGQIFRQFLVLLLSLLLASLAARFDHQLGTDLQWSFFYVLTSCWNVKRKRLLLMIILVNFIHIQTIQHVIDIKKKN